MALSGSKTVSVGAYWSVILEWTATQSIANNTSTVEARLYWQSNGSQGAVYSSASKAVSLTIDGNRKTGTTTAALNGGQKKLILSHSRTVSHNSVGEKNVAISGIFDMEVTLSGVFRRSATASGTWALNDIARKSSFTMNDYAIWYDQSATVSISRASSSFTHTITYTIGSISRTIASKTSSTSVAFTPNVGDLEAFPNSYFGTATMKVETFNGTSSLGSVTRTFTIHAREGDHKPNITSFTVGDNNAAINTLMGAGNFVQGHSDLTFSVGASGKYGASIKSRSISFNGQSSSSASWNYGEITKSGTITATAKVTDSRGFVTTGSLSVTIIPYSAPRVSSFTAARLATSAETVRTSYTVSISDLKVGTTSKNTLTVKLEYKPRTYTAWTTFGTYTEASRLTDITGMLEANSYDLRIVVSDKLTTGTFSVASVSTAAVLMDLAQYGIGIGKMWERGALDVRGNAYFKGDIYFDTPNGGLNFLNTNGTTYNSLHMKDNFLYLNNNDVLKFVEGDSNGHGIALGAGGLTVIGGGESYRNFIDGYIATGKTGGAEEMWVTSDYDVNIQTGMQNGYGTGHTWTFYRSGNLIPPQSASIEFDDYGNIVTPSRVTSATWNVKNANGKIMVKVPVGSNSGNAVDLGQFTFESNRDTNGGEGMSAIVFRSLGSTNKEFLLVDEVTNGYYFHADQALPSPGTTGTANGNLYAAKFNVTSDESQKEEIVEYTATALDKIKVTKPYKYKHKKSNERITTMMKNGTEEKDSLGLLAQEAPFDITTDSGLGIDLYAMNTLMWKAIQELSAELDATKQALLDYKVKDVEPKIKEHKEKIDKLELTVTDLQN